VVTTAFAYDGTFIYRLSYRHLLCFFTGAGSEILFLPLSSIPHTCPTTLPHNTHHTVPFSCAPGVAAQLCYAHFLCALYLQDTGNAGHFFKHCSTPLRRRLNTGCALHCYDAFAPAMLFATHGVCTFAFPRVATASPPFTWPPSPPAVVTCKRPFAAPAARARTPGCGTTAAPLPV